SRPRQSSPHLRQCTGAPESGAVPYMLQNKTIYSYRFSICSFLKLFNFISDSPYDLQIARVFRIDLNLLTDMPDMNRHGIIRPDRLFVPDVFIDLVDGKDLALILYKQEENIVLRRRQLHNLAVHRHFLEIIVDGKTSHRVDLFLISGADRAAKLRISAEL